MDLGLGMIKEKEIKKIRTYLAEGVKSRQVLIFICIEGILAVFLVIISIFLYFP